MTGKQRAQSLIHHAFVAGTLGVPCRFHLTDGHLEQAFQFDWQALLS